MTELEELKITRADAGYAADVCAADATYEAAAADAYEAEKGRVLKVDEKWSITYDPDNNDRPLKLFRYDVDINVNMHNEKNYVLAMFYRILELENSS
jgi:hypothetical protein